MTCTETRSPISSHRLTTRRPGRTCTCISRYFIDSSALKRNNSHLAEKIASRRRAPGGCGARQSYSAREDELHYANERKSGQLESVPPEIAQQVKSAARASPSHSRKSGTRRTTIILESSSYLGYSETNQQ
jgi:hypothetical protein